MGSTHPIHVSRAIRSTKALLAPPSFWWPEGFLVIGTNRYASPVLFGQGFVGPFFSTTRTVGRTMLFRSLIAGGSLLVGKPSTT